MATRKISDIELAQMLKGFNKPYFTVADLEKILDLKREVLYVTLNRLVKAGVLVKLKRGIYKGESQSLELERAANEIYYPSYLSFESALSRYGILNQIPYTLTFATTKTSKRQSLRGKEVEYRRLKSSLFFGYNLIGGIYVAEPEKAILDELYLMSKGRIAVDTGEWSLVGLNKKKLLEYAKKFPPTVRKHLKALIPKLGKHTVTL